jgi:hypothetical protein
VKSKTRSVVLCMVIYAVAVTAAAQSTWKLSKNLLETNNQISFNQGSNKVWYFLQSKSFAHDPRTYQFLSAYYEPCVSDSASHWVDGMPCWQNPEVVGGYRLPLVGINSTYAIQNVKNFPFPPRSVFVHPSSSGLAIIGWRSPFTGSVNVSGFFSDLDPTGFNGVIWSVDLGSQTLATGTIANGGPAQTFSLMNVSVKAGQVMYFIVDPDGDISSDATGVDVTITKVRHVESEE